MAEEIHSPASDPQRAETSLTRRDRGRTGALPGTKTAAARRPKKQRAARTAPAGRASGKKAGPLRSLVILSMVGGLIATVALPAYGSWRPEAEAVTLQQVAADDAQSLLVASDSTGAALARESYSATTQEEIDQRKAEEAAAAAAAARARLTSTVSAGLPVNIALVSPGSGEVRWPLLNFTLGRGLWDSGYHQGVDLLAAGGTPIYAAAAGVVSVSQESYGGYGVAVTIDHVIGGQSVNTLYGHMTYGSRQVSAGQYVQAGQIIGLVGSTGSSTANHLHFEVHINGGVVDPWAWLQANAG
ncbi:M23 family metallopeptidase [Microbacterium sp. zg.B48]|uniref:M23 family metallopeptidase n=1 Tax=unclassified Microbacterium TaxID=2609290 RepID=UPI00214B6B03|nr:MULTISPECIES: M23 family metallopeptidase [unclassified Microbacterium]MCR2762508.1 M23 family metallopeptidase [Microbacterium sp. zg.B48]MCR2810678.1 M23 family metallopeptidase [Microbacterium sp. zg.B185]WIM18215.1 M23 family metallopeptidase [Microbacterium sp. zg-B185]